METLKVAIKKITYTKPDSRWMIFRAESDGRAFTCKGVIPWEIQEGDLIELEGEWKKSGYTGEDEFSFRTACASVPEDSRSLLAYAVSLTPGLGPELEKKIWEKYGEKWIETQVLEIKGVREHTAFYWLDTLNRVRTQRNQAAAISFLISKGCTLNMANAAWNMWKHSTYATVNENPYMLAELPCYSFADVDDAIRKNFGIGDRDVRRIDAAVLYLMNRLAETGSTVADRADLEMQFIQLVGGSAPELFQAVRRLMEAGQLKQVKQNKIALTRNFDDEAAIWKKFAASWEV